MTLLGALAVSGCARPPLSTPGPNVTGEITVWGQRRVVTEVRVEDHRIWGPDGDDILRFDDGYRGHSRFGLVSLQNCDHHRICGNVGGAPTSFTVEKDAKGMFHAEGTWWSKKFSFELDENELNGVFGYERYFLRRDQRPALFYRGKTGYNPFYDASIQLPDKFLELNPEEMTIYLLATLVR